MRDARTLKGNTEKRGKGMKKRRGWIRKTAGLMLLAMTAWMLFSPTAQALRALPDRYRLTLGESQYLNAGVAVLSSQDERLVSLEANTLSAQDLGQAKVTVNLFGLFPVRQIEVDVREEIRLIPGGQAVGVALATKGVLVVGVSDVSGQSPAQAAGLKPGDVLESINGQALTSSEQLSSLVASAKGSPLSIIYQREGKSHTAHLTPLVDSSSGLWRIGAWVRDSTAGVGTLSYYNPQNQSYGALGHAINDGDTGKLLPIRMGSLLKADIVDVRRGQKGTPGELRGSFLRDQVILGDIDLNTPLGIYGDMDRPVSNPLYPDGLPVGYQETIKPGPATILSTVDGNGIREYEVEITHVNRQSSPGAKSMVIHVTDPDLLSRTGGIVQGMSGSPIIQNGHIIGAVTHVFVDDPTRGYGIFIENMLDAAG